MSRARLLTSVIAALYFGVLIGLTFVQGSVANRMSPLWSFLLFVPVGILLVLLLGRRRWWVAVWFGVLGAAWVEAAQTIWMPVGYASAWDIVWASSGVVVGVTLVAGLSSRKAVRSHATPRIVAHPSPREVSETD